MSRMIGQHFLLALLTGNGICLLLPCWATRPKYKLNIYLEKGKTEQILVYKFVHFLVIREFSIQDLLTSTSTILILLRHFA